MRISSLGDAGILIEFGKRADAKTAARVAAAVRALGADRLAGVVDLVPSYTTIGVHYDPDRIDADSPQATVSEWAKRAIARTNDTELAPGREVVVPVCYGGEYGPDLVELAAFLKLTPEGAVKLHGEGVYPVRAIGFVPGFPYLAGLSKRLHAPRRATPRTVVPAGSVAVGGAQTGIYPIACPGGWHLIGRTSLRLFRPDREPPSLLQVSDRVRFRSVSADELRAAEGAS